MFTYIVPTIFKSEKWKFQTNEVAKNGNIKKIYIIVDLPEENNKIDLGIFDKEIQSKIEVLHTGGSEFCNGAWNFAMKQMKSNNNLQFINNNAFVFFVPESMNLQPTPHAPPKKT